MDNNKKIDRIKASADKVITVNPFKEDTIGWTIAQMTLIANGYYTYTDGKTKEKVFIEGRK